MDPTDSIILNFTDTNVASHMHLAIVISFVSNRFDMYELITLAKGPEMLAIGYHLLLMFEQGQ